MLCIHSAQRCGESLMEFLSFLMPKPWPLRHSMTSWSAMLRDLKHCNWEFRARAVDMNGFAQPEPRPIAKAGKNAVEVHRFEVA